MQPPGKDFGAAWSSPPSDTICVCMCSVVQMVGELGFQKQFQFKIVFLH